MVAAADPVPEILGFGAGQLPGLDGRLQFGASVPGPDLTQDGLETGRVRGSAQAFGFLAARGLKGLPLSYPATTGVPIPMTGGIVARP